MTLLMLRDEADRTAQDALHRLVRFHEVTGRWDRRLSAEYHAAEVLLDMVDDRIRDMMADATEPEGYGLPDIALVDPGDHFAYPGGAS